MMMMYDMIFYNRDTELKMRELDEEIKRVMIGNLLC